MEHDELDKALVLLAAAYPNFDLREQTVEVYNQALSDVPIGLLQLATSHAIKTSKFFPTVAELRALVADIMMEETVPTPLGAWSNVWLHEGDLKFLSTPTKQALAAIGGWGYIRYSDNAIADRSQFIREYEREVAALRRRVILKPAAFLLPGSELFVDLQFTELPELETALAGDEP